MEPSTLNRTRGRTHGSEWWMTLSSIHWLKHHWMKLLGLLKQWLQKLAIDSKVGSHPNPLLLFLDFILLGDTMLDVCLIMVNNTLHALIIMQWLFWTLKVLYHRTWFYGPINSSRSFLCQKMQCAAQNFLSIFAFSIALLPFLALLGRVRLKIFLNFHLDVALIPRLALLVLHFSCFSQLGQCWLYLLQY